MTPSRFPSYTHHWVKVTYGLLCLVARICITGSETLKASVTFHPDIVLPLAPHLTCHDGLNLTINIAEGEDVTLNLKRSVHIDYNKIPIISSNHNRSEEWTSNRIYQARHPCFYNDMEKYSAISLTFIDGGSYSIRGVFHTDLYSYTFSTSKSPLKDVHLIERKKNHESYLKEKPLWGRTKRQTQTKTSYTVELLVVIDFPLYKRWFTWSKKVSQADRERDAIENIKYYFTHIVHEMDLRYRSIDTNDFSISIALSALYIAKASNVLSWQESIKETTTVNGETRLSFRGSTGLDLFGQWLSQSTGFRVYDHAMLFTGFDLYEVNPMTSTKSYNKIGTSYLSRICSSGFRVSIVEDRAHFKSALTAAHELGHNLGASHDGVGNDCSSGDQYIMASSVESRTDENIFRFSTCSISAFRDILRMLGGGLRTHCLNNGKRVFNQTAKDIYLKQSPGRKYTPDDQCQIVYGQGSFFCGGQKDVARMCQNLICHNPKDTHCYSLGSTPAFPGTICGNKKVCKRGQCVYDADAPERPENCTLGDTKDSILLGETKYQCAKLIETYPALCYGAELRDLCCASCGKIHKPNSPTCPYGDKQMGCSRLGLSSCKLNHEICCESCAIYMTGIPGCEFGDQMRWCGTMRSDQCYLPEGNLCCETCHQYKTNITGCDFGDRIEDCNINRCTSEYDLYNCCGTCASLKTTSELPTPTPSSTTTSTKTTTYKTATPPTTQVAESSSKSSQITVPMRKESSTENEQTTPGDKISSGKAFIHKVTLYRNVVMAAVTVTIATMCLTNLVQ